MLINTSTQKPIRELTNDGTINLAVDGDALNLRADVSGNVGSVAFILDGQMVHSENYAPFALKGDLDGVFIKWTPAPAVGTHTLRVVPYASKDRKGSVGQAIDIKFKVSNVAPSKPVPATGPNLMLINTSTQKVIRQLTNKSNINLAVDGSALNIRADVSGTVGSVAFTLDGKLVHSENYAPFALGGDHDGVFIKWTPTVGTHTLRVVPYASKDRKGTAGVASEITFTVTNVAPTTAPAISKLVLINTTTQKSLRDFVTGSTINLASDGSALNVRADVSGKVGSVAFTLDGKLVHSENYAPFALAGDHDGVFIKWTPTIGSHTLRVVPYADKDRKGTAGAAAEVKFTVSNVPPVTTSSAISRLMLMNTNSQQVIRELKTGGIINLAVDGIALNVRADATGKVGSVAFTLDGKLVHSENYAPFAIAGDRDGIFIKWTPTIGSHTLRVVPYAEKDRKGAAGTFAEVKFEVTNVTPGNGSGNPDAPSSPKPAPTPPPVVKSILYKADGQLDLSLYGLLALSYDKATMEMRLGPSFLDLSPNAPDDRPTLFHPASKLRTSGYVRTNPYELGSNPKTDGDYWSESGQVGYVPDSVNDAGLDRIQVYAYYDRVFAISPRLDWASGKPHSDPQTREPHYKQIFGQAPKHPIAMVRNYGHQMNEALVLYREGYLAVVGTQTSRAGHDRPYPGFTFPTNKIPTALAVTTSNEFALVTVWDTSTQQGQLAVFALEGKYIPYHTWPYMGLPNQGSWSAFKLLGYVDLPMATPTSVAAASNGWWSGPSQTGGLVLSQIDLGLDKHRKHVYDGIWKAVIARNGYAIVASQYDNKVAIVDLSALFAYMRESYLSSASSFKATVAARGTGATQFPQTFAARPSITPTVVLEMDVPTPTTVLAGLRLDRWSKDHFKAYVASRDGTIRIFDTSSIMQRFDWERRGALRVVGSFNVGRNPVSMCFTRRSDRDLPLLPVTSDGTQTKPDTLNNMLYIAVRGDRKVVAAVTFNGAGAVYKTIKDKRMGDPVAVSTAIRGPILSVADFRGKKMLSFRVGKINDLRNKVLYGMGADGNDPFEFTGEVPFNGHPFLINTTNVN